MILTVLLQIVEFYSFMIIAYVLLSWFPSSGFVGEVRRTLATFVEPYLGLFRRFVPPIGMIDISPIVAILVLQLFTTVLVRLF